MKAGRQESNEGSKEGKGGRRKEEEEKGGREGRKVRGGRKRKKRGGREEIRQGGRKEDERKEDCRRKTNRKLSVLTFPYLEPFFPTLFLSWSPTSAL